MSKVLITGSQGFVGSYLRKELENNNYDVVGLDINADTKTLNVDLLNYKQVSNALRQTKPDAVIHLAGQANVGLSWKLPQKTIEINTIGAVNLMDGIREFAPSAKLVLVGTSDQYGVLGEAGESVTEELPLNPQTPYAVSKMAQEEMAKIYVRAYDMDICMTRSFNHAGAGQREGFMIADFAAGIVRVEKGISPCLNVGNLISKRDFTHVCDIVKAYRLIAEKGHKGEIYNVGSGTVYSAQEILDKLLGMALCPVPVATDESRIRPVDTPVIRCNHTRLTNHTGWLAEYRIEEILEDVLLFYRQIL